MPTKEEAIYQLFSQGNGYFKEGKYNNAIEKYDEAIELEKDEYLLINKGIALNKLERFEEALKILSKVKESFFRRYFEGFLLDKGVKNPFSTTDYFEPELHFSLGEALERRGHDQEAGIELEAAMRMDPEKIHKGSVVDLDEMRYRKYIRKRLTEEGRKLQKIINELAAKREGKVKIFSISSPYSFNEVETFSFSFPDRDQAVSLHVVFTEGMRIHYEQPPKNKIIIVLEHQSNLKYEITLNPFSDISHLARRNVFVELGNAEFDRRFEVSSSEPAHINGVLIPTSDSKAFAKLLFTPEIQRRLIKIQDIHLKINGRYLRLDKYPWDKSFFFDISYYDELLDFVLLIQTRLHECIGLI